MIIKNIRSGINAFLKVTHDGFHWVKIQNVQVLKDGYIALSYYFEGDYLEELYHPGCEVLTKA